MTFQGLLTDKSGLGVTGDRIIKFSMYDSSVSGEALWQETQTVAVVQGLYSVTLGSKAAFPLDLWERPEVWLGMKVGDDTEMVPRMRILAVPYALRAEDASGIKLRTPCVVGRKDWQVGASTFDYDQDGTPDTVYIMAWLYPNTENVRYEFDMDRDETNDDLGTFSFLVRSEGNPYNNTAIILRNNGVVFMKNFDCDGTGKVTKAVVEVGSESGLFSGMPGYIFYDENGFKTKIIYSNCSQVYYNDEKGRDVKREYLDSQGNVTNTVMLFYDDADRVVRAATIYGGEKGSLLQYISYDENGNMQKREYDGTGNGVPDGVIDSSIYYVWIEPVR